MKPASAASLALLTVLIARLPAAAEAKKGPPDGEPPDLEKLISEAVGKAVEKTLKELFEKHGLQPDEQALLTSVDTFAPAGLRGGWNRLTISVINSTVTVLRVSIP